MRWLVAVLGCVLVACSQNKIDRILVRRPIQEAMLVPDTDYACTAARANRSMASAFLRKHPPHRTLTILESTAVICLEHQIWELELAILRAKRAPPQDIDTLAIRDLQAREQRLRRLAAERSQRAWMHVQAKYGELGEACPKLRRNEDEYALLMGLLAGANALLYDQSSGGTLGVSTGIMAQIGRASQCLDSAAWYHLPGTLRAAWWVMVPGAAPQGVDAWQALDQAAAQGDSTGVRLGRAIQGLLAANAGQTERVNQAIRAFNDVKIEPPPQVLLLDAYATEILRHQADVLWTTAKGYRAPGVILPPTESSADPTLLLEEDPFL